MGKTLLKKIAKIGSGQSFRHKIEHNPNGACRVIQMKDISNERLDIVGKPLCVNRKDVNPNQLLNKGDILFMAKGNNNFAVLFNSDMPAVAVSLFFIIRPNQSLVNPEFLTWFLNSSSAQSYFYEQRLGASVGNIRKDALENLAINLPSIDKQVQIAKLNRLMQKEKLITTEYLEKKELFLNQIMLNLSLELRK